MTIHEHIFSVDINEPLIRRFVGLLGNHDKNANRFGARLTRGGADVDLAGYSVYAYFIRPDESTVLVNGVIEGNLVYADMPESCYFYNGACTVSIKISNEDITQTVLICDSIICQTSTEEVVEGEYKILSVTEIAELIADMDAATREAESLTQELRTAMENGDFNGNDGFSPSANVEQTSEGAVITVVDANGTTTATVKNGVDGVGVAGVSVTRSPDEYGFFYIILELTDGQIQHIPYKNGAATVEQTEEGAVVSITDAYGTTTAVVRNGSDGEPGEPGTDGRDGYSPVRGTDYWTDADQEAIVQQVIAALGTPVFGTIDENNVITLTGALADGKYMLQYEDVGGEVTEIGELSLIAYTNQIPISTDTDGSIYNGTGYKLATRGNSSGAAIAITEGTNPAFFTGFIPCKQGDIIRLKNCFMEGKTSGGSAKTLYGEDLWGLRSGLYNTSKAKVDVFSWGFFKDGNTAVVSDYTIPADGKVQQFTIAKAGVSYMRLTLAADVDNGFTAADAIVTVNEEIP